MNRGFNLIQKTLIFKFFWKIGFRTCIASRKYSEERAPDSYPESIRDEGSSLCWKVGCFDLLNKNLLLVKTQFNKVYKKNHKAW